MAKYSYEEKVAAVKLILDDGLSTYEAAKISGISRTPIVRWLERYKQFGPEGLLMKHGTYLIIFSNIFIALKKYRGFSK